MADTPKLIAHEEGCPALHRHSDYDPPCSPNAYPHACTCRGEELERKATNEQVADAANAELQNVNEDEVFGDSRSFAFLWGFSRGVSWRESLASLRAADGGKP